MLKVVNFVPVFETKNDCYLVAFCACFNVNYEEAKKTKITSNCDTIVNVLEGMGYPFVSMSNNTPNAVAEKKNITVNSFVSTHNTGTYYLLLLNNNNSGAGHAVALIDGVCYDSIKDHPNYNEYYVHGYF